MIKNTAFTEQVVKCLAEGSRVLISSRPGAGKTFFVKEILIPILKKADMRSVYYDCHRGFDVRGFLESYARAVFGSVDGDLKKVFEEYAVYLPNIKPTFSIDPIKGVEVSVSYQYSDKKLRSYMKEMIDLPEKISQHLSVPLILVFDDVELLHDEVRDCLTTELISKKNSEVYYVFLSGINTEKSKKSYYNKQLVFPETGKEELLLNCTQTFKKQGIEFRENVPDAIWEYSNGDLRLYNWMLDKLCEEQKLDLRKVNSAIESLLIEREDVFHNYFNALSFHQKKLMRAIAVDSGAQVFKGEFIFVNELVSVPSVQTSIKGLIKKRIISKRGRDHVINDGLFRLWLRRM